MNTDQINSFIRTLFKIVGSALVTHGMTKTGDLLNSEDIIGLVITIIGVLASHNWHKETAPTSPPSGSGGTSAGGTAALLVALGAASLLFTGCVMPNADHSPGAPAYVVAGQLTNNLATAQTVATIAAPIAGAIVPAVAPFTPLASGLIYALGGLLVAISGAWATWKSNQAAKQSAAAAALAATIPPASHPQALANAATNGSTAQVAAHLQASQSPT